MDGPLSEPGVTLPVLAAPMAGGAGTTAPVVAAAHSRGLGFVPAGYPAARTLAERVAEVRAARVLFGVQFAPNPLPADRAAFDTDARHIRAEATASAWT